MNAASTSTFADQYPLRVLVAEDHELNQHLFFSMLKRMGYTPQLVRDGPEVVQAVLEGEFDCVLMDINMPTMDGLEATRQIRAGEAAEGLRATYIIAVTANAMSGDREGFLSSGMDDYLPKPFAFAQLKDALLRCWERR